jgi:hypothetical protein
MRWVVAMAAAFGLSACAAVPAGSPAKSPAETPVLAGPAQPVCPHVPPPAETAPPVAPRSGFPQVLQPGYWSWSGHDYAWVKARWLTLLAHRRPLWQAEYWSAEAGACVWHEAHFVYLPRHGGAPRGA